MTTEDKRGRSFFSRYFVSDRQLLANATMATMKGEGPFGVDGKVFV
jgi:hypothetical protein